MNDRLRYETGDSETHSDAHIGVSDRSARLSTHDREADRIAFDPEVGIGHRIHPIEDRRG